MALLEVQSLLFVDVLKEVLKIILKQTMVRFTPMSGSTKMQKVDCRSTSVCSWKRRPSTLRSNPRSRPRGTFSPYLAKNCRAPKIIEARTGERAQTRHSSPSLTPACASQARAGVRRWYGGSNYAQTRIAVGGDSARGDRSAHGALRALLSM